MNFSSLGLCEFYFPLEEAPNEQHSVIKYSKRHYVTKSIVWNCVTILQVELMDRRWMDGWMDGKKGGKAERRAVE